MKFSGSWARAAAAAAAAATVLTGASARADHAWLFHWPRAANPLLLQVGDNVSSRWDPHLAAAIDDWAASQVLDFIVVPGHSKPVNCRPSLGMIEVCNAKSGQNGWLGIAQVWIDGPHITQAVARMNDTYMNMRPYDTPAWRQFLMCQEVGHTFGLDHQDEVFDNANLGSCMDYTRSPETNQHPNAHDFAELVDIYSHLDAPQAAALGADDATAGDLEDPRAWGRLASRGNRTDRYERDLGDGRKLVTFVIWASVFDR